MKTFRYLAAAAALLMASGAYAEITNTVLDLGDFTAPTEQISGQNLEQAPFNFYYTSSGSQVIYTAEEIAPMVNRNAAITSISFVYGDPDFSSYGDFENTLECYIQLIDAAQFTYVDYKSHWFQPANVSSTATLDYEYNIYKLGDTDIITLTFPEPFQLNKNTDAGKNLLVTSTQTFTSGDSDDGQYWRPYVYNNVERTYRMACYGFDGDNDFFSRVEEGGLIYTSTDHSDCYRTDIPVVRFEYTYDDIIDGVANVEMTDDAPVQMYDLQGREVSRDYATPGIYILRQGNKTTKTVIK